MQINAANVQITKSQINGTIYTTDEIGARQTVTVTDSEIRIGNNAGTGIGDANWTAIRVEITGGNRSANCWYNCTIQDSYVHGQFTDPSGLYHESGIRMGANGIITHNYILCDAPDVPPDGGCSADLTGYGDFATVHDMTVNQNYFGPTTGGYCAYGGSSASKPYPNAYNMKFTNNIFARAAVAQHTESGGKTCAYYGTISDFDTGASGNVWSSNKYIDNGIVTP